MMLRLIGQILLSAILALPTLFVAGAVVWQMGQSVPLFRDSLPSIINSMVDTFGDFLFFALVWFVFFIFYMLLFSWRRYAYTARVLKSVRHISEGHFEHIIDVKQNNELGRLAEGVNVIVTRLKTSLEEERRAEQTKNELITNVSHDLRTPLTSIIGYLELVDKDRYRDEVEMRYYAQIAYEKSLRLKTLINDLFEYTRLRHDAVPLQRMPLNLVEMLGQLLAQYRLSLQEAGMEGQLHAGLTYLPILGDPSKLVRVFENLFSNAMSYGKEGKRLDIFVRQEGEQAVVEVVNYGEPISTLDLPHVFDRFYRVEKSRSEQTGGSGLGLAIAKGIIERHGGSIAAASDSTRTSFMIRLPVLKEGKR